MADSATDFLAQFGMGLDAAVNERHLPNPVMAVSNPNQTDSAAYIRAVRARLIELGYLAEGDKRVNRSNNTLDPILVKKIKQLQQEAGIEVDGWAGPETWQVLECLVSFENQQQPANWQQVWAKPLAQLIPAFGMPNLALLRGIYCRLYSMGFFSDWEQHRIHTKTILLPQGNPAFALAIARFAQFAGRLGLLSTASLTLTEPLVHALYQHDAIVLKLADAALFAEVTHEFQHNIEAISRIELWLLGYDITPGQDQTEWERLRAKRSARPRRQLSKTTLAISRFYQDNSSEALHAKQQSNTVDAQLMAAFAVLTHEPSKDIYLGKQLNNTVQSILSHNQHKKEFQNQFARLANGIFDGLKRVIRWLFRAVKQLQQFTTEFIANLARYISRKARKFYIGVVKAIDIVHAGTSYLRNSVYQFSQPANLLFSHDHDFDQYCLLSPSATPAQIKHHLVQYRYRVKLYAASLNIISHLMRMAHRVLKTVTTPFGWLLALLALADFANSAKAIKQQLDSIADYQLSIDVKQALFQAHIS
ncbi:MAG: peptidoglycan-binding protein [Alishewanella sp.]|nr:peptidoglycan-binding protein [Alishewanella sp.]